MEPYIDKLIVQSSHYPLFEWMTEAEIKDICAFSKHETYTAGDVIFQRGDYGDDLYVVLGGTLAVYVPHNDDENERVALLCEGDFFGEIALLGQSKRTATVIAEEDSEVLRIGKSTLGHLADDDPKAAVHLWQAIAQVSSERLKRRDQQVQKVKANTDNFRREVVSLISHEFRTPVTVIKASADLLSLKELPEEKRSEILSRVVSQSNQITRLLEDIIDITDQEHGKMMVLSHENVDLLALFYKVVDASAELIDQQKVSISQRWSQPNMVMRGDPVKLEKALRHLLDNAIKYSAKGGTVSVENEGEIFPTEIIAEMTRPFRQSKSTLVRSKGGLGLGLPLIREIVGSHGGQLHIRPQAERTAVELHLPQRETPES
jgi:signal transduction histidine kinase